MNQQVCGRDGECGDGADAVHSDRIQIRLPSIGYEVGDMMQIGNRNYDVMSEYKPKTHFAYIDFNRAGG